jgi:hypothetical protein
VPVTAPKTVTVVGIEVVEVRTPIPITGPAKSIVVATARPNDTQ